MTDHPEFQGPFHGTLGRHDLRCPGLPVNSGFLGFELSGEKWEVVETENCQSFRHFGKGEFRGSRITLSTMTDHPEFQGPFHGTLGRHDLRCLGLPVNSGFSGFELSGEKWEVVETENCQSFRHFDKGEFRRSRYYVQKSTVTWSQDGKVKQTLPFSGFPAEFSYLFLIITLNPFSIQLKFG
jgi:hypothetical protein